MQNFQYQSVLLFAQSFCGSQRINKQDLPVQQQVAIADCKEAMKDLAEVLYRQDQAQPKQTVPPIEQGDLV